MGIAHHLAPGTAPEGSSASDHSVTSPPSGRPPQVERFVERPPSCTKQRASKPMRKSRVEVPVDLLL